MSYGMCPAMDVLVASVRTAMKQVSALGKANDYANSQVGDDPRFGRGVDFLDRHDVYRGWGLGVLYGEGCVAAVAEGQSVLDGVNDLLSQYGLGGVTVDIHPDVTPNGPLDSLRPVITGLAVIAGVVLLFPIVQEVVFARKTSRRLAGRNRRHR